MERQGYFRGFQIVSGLFVWVVLAVLLLSVDSWASCYSSSYGFEISGRDGCRYGNGCNPSTCSNTQQCRAVANGCPAVRHSGSCYWTKSRLDVPTECRVDSYPSECLSTGGGYPRCWYALCCSDQRSADSVNCVAAGNVWDSSVPKCNPPCGPQCQCEQSGGEWKGTWCRPNCQSRFCCDSLNQNAPVQTEKRWLGCVAENPDNDRCQVYNVGITPGDTSISAECNGKSKYEVCTISNEWSESARQCGELPTNNCRTYTVSDSMCTKVLCDGVQKKEIGALDYDSDTQCYTGTVTVRTMLICSNGLREEKGVTTQSFTVCKEYLDRNGLSLSEYLSGGTSGGGSVGGSFGGSGGGDGFGGGGSGSEGGSGSGGGSEGGSGSGGGSAGGGAYGGGGGVNANGDSVVNSPSPGLGGNWTNTPEIAVEVDSNGNVEIIKNSDGGDSINVTSVFNKIECRGVYRGVATLTNGLNTWTCEASSCSQAVISASISGGACSPVKNGIEVSETNPSMPVVNGDSSWYQLRFVEELEDLLEYVGTFNASVNANADHARRQRDSLADAHKEMWRRTFGDDFSYIHNIMSASSDGFGIPSAVYSAAGGTQSAIGSASSDLSRAIGSASSHVSTAVGNAANSISGVIRSASSELIVSNDNLHIAITSNTSAVNAVAGAVESQGQSITGAINALASASSNRDVVDTLHNTNDILSSIEASVVDTGKTIPASIWSLDSTVSSLPRKIDSMGRYTLDLYADDKLQIIADTNTAKIVGAIEGLDVQVNLDSVTVNVPHDSILDSINDNLKQKMSFSMELQNDTLDFGKLYKMGYDSTVNDTSFVMDSSEVQSLKEMQYVDANDVSDGGYVDSVESTLQAKYDSSNAYYNSRSDSMVLANLDSARKYSGINKIDSGVREFFGGYSPDCPRDCFIVRSNIALPGGRTTVFEVDLARIVCDVKFIGNRYGIFDFIKLILRVMTSMLCVFLIARGAFGSRNKKDTTWGYW